MLAVQSNSKSIKYLDKYLCLHFKTEKGKTQCQQTN
nr:MAG TPA: hypothetical protein [Caudoviricetes sp.]